MIRLLRSFGFGLLGGSAGAAIGLVWNMLAEQEKSRSGLLGNVFLTLLIQIPFVLAASAAGVLLGSRLSPGAARQFGVTPGFLLGLGFLLLAPDLGILPWALLSFAPALASGAAAVVHAGERHLHENPAPKQ
jgi:hypothetical protein